MGPSVSEAGENDGVVACGLAAWAVRELMGHARGWEKREGVGRPAGLASLGRATGYEALSLHLSFSFSFVLCLFA